MSRGRHFGLEGQALEDTMRRAIFEKPARHHLNETHHSETHRNMNAIGG